MFWFSQFFPDFRRCYSCLFQFSEFLIPPKFVKVFCVFRITVNTHSRSRKVSAGCADMTYMLMYVSVLCGLVTLGLDLMTSDLLTLLLMTLATFYQFRIGSFHWQKTRDRQTNIRAGCKTQSTLGPRNDNEHQSHITTET